jgi:branched-chain amino acid transport system permease protein
MTYFNTSRIEMKPSVIHGVILLGICLVPLFISEYYLMLAIEAIILAVFAMSLDLVMGYAGIVSFGHAAFFGCGGYALGITIMHISPSIWLALILVAVIAGCLAFFVGVVSIRTRGIYFAILTLLFAEIVYRVVFHTQALGGSDGLIGIPVCHLNLLFFKVHMKKTLNFYYVAVVFAYLSYIVCSRLVNSPFGRVLQALRDNEDRVPFIGFDVRKYKIIVFVISGIFAGWSGALFSLFKTFADTEQLHFLMSGKVIIMDLLGGLGTLIGPMAGAIFLTIYETIISAYFQSYHIITGAIFIVVVIFLPKGLLGLALGFRGRGRR